MTVGQRAVHSKSEGSAGQEGPCKMSSERRTGANRSGSSQYPSFLVSRVRSLRAALPPGVTLASEIGHREAGAYGCRGASLMLALSSAFTKSPPACFSYAADAACLLHPVQCPRPVLALGHWTGKLERCGSVCLPASSTLPEPDLHRRARWTSEVCKQQKEIRQPTRSAQQSCSPVAFAPDVSLLHVSTRVTTEEKAPSESPDRKSAGRPMAESLPAVLRPCRNFLRPCTCEPGPLERHRGNPCHLARSLREHSWSRSARREESRCRTHLADQLLSATPDSVRAGRAALLSPIVTSPFSATHSPG